ncbi:MAG: hypothetical protein EYC70_16910 [Planctomycetota bacterium]|nr:MAG: hypothetical protein EYC70_16910 [Planctomycetota bacterium]
MHPFPIVLTLAASTGPAALLGALFFDRFVLPGFLRETVLVQVSGALLVAVALGLLVFAVLRAARVSRPPGGILLGLGVALGLLPVAMLGLAHAAAVAALAALAALWLLPPLRRATPARAALAALAAPAPLLLAWMAFAPPSGAVDLPDAGAAPAGGRPDIVLISVDTLRADAVADPAAPLPALARLRDRSLWAEYALSSSSSTRPAHFTLLSGWSALMHGVAGNEYGLRADVPMLAERLREAGYTTAGVVSNAMLRRGSGFERGFEVYDESPIVRRGPREDFEEQVVRRSWWRWLGLGEFPAAVRAWLHGSGWSVIHGDSGNGRHTTDSALRLLRALQAQAAPYFLFVHYMDPHAPYWPPEATAGRLYGSPEIPQRYRPGGILPGEHRMLVQLGEAAAAGDAQAAGLLRQMHDLYGEEVLFVDAMLGELLAQVEATGRPTVLVFTSDHGEQFGEHGLVLHSNSIYESLVRVPFLLSGPGVSPGRLPAPPQLEDVAPTLLACAGLGHDDLPGRDLRAQQLAETGHVERYSQWIAVRDGRWKLHGLLDRGPDGRLRVQATALFDLAADAEESTDLLSGEPEVAARLLARLQEAVARADTGAEARLETDPRHLQAMHELGYAGEEQ